MIDITGKEKDRIITLPRMGWYSAVSRTGKNPNPALAGIRGCFTGAEGGKPPQNLAPIYALASA